jgi:hypothetical protein
MDSSILSDSIPYAYEPLPGSNFIRLMHVEPALHADDPIRFSFQTAKLAELVAQYEAISYTWGEPKRDHPLYIADGNSVQVTRNLDKALRGLRHPTTTRVLWADSACINQIDNDEKTMQIPLMAKIFRGASRVLAWLDSGPKEERGMLLLNRLSRTELFLSDEKIRNRSLHLFNLWNREDDSVSIRKFLNLAWFTRLWIVQEIVMNTDVILICRDSSITWLRFTTAMENLWFFDRSVSQNAASTGKYKSPALEKIISLWKQHNMSYTRHTEGNHPAPLESILDLVGQFCDYGCLDPRDRIFALYNIAMDICSSGTTEPGCIRMDVDYSSDCKQTYQNFASACIAQRRPVLDLVLARQYAPSPDDWPSWVPDWRKPPSILHDGFEHQSVGMAFWQISPNIVDLSTHCTDSFHDGKFPIVDEIIMPSNTIDGVTDSLLLLCKGRPLFTILSMLWDLLPSREDKHRAFANHIIASCKAPLHEKIPIDLAQMGLDLQAAMKHKCFFFAVSPHTKSRVIGSGNAAMAKGDKILPTMAGSKGHPKRYLRRALLLRQHATRSGVENVDIVTYKLIGSATYLSAENIPFSSVVQRKNLYIE